MIRMTDYYEDIDDVNELYEILITKINTNVYGSKEQEKMIELIDRIIDWFGGLE